jgi:uncharacterized protein (TIGR00251 family)
VGEIRVRVQPRASRDEIAGERDGAVVIRVTAPPVGGEANEAVRRLVAKRVGVAKGHVKVVRGTRGRDKVIAVEGVTAAELRRRLLG